MSEEARVPVPRGDSRRRALVAIAAVLAVGGGVAAWLTRAAAEGDIAEATSLAQEAYAALRSGDITRALDLATRARTLDPKGAQPLAAWLHATGVSLLEGEPDSAKAVGFVAEVRKLDLRHPALGFATVASAVAMRNDRFARKLLDQHEEQGVGGDAFYDFAAGAAHDLDCDPAGAEAWFASSASRWQDALLPRVRRARSLLFEERFADARGAIAAIPDGAAKSLLEDLLARLSEGKPSSVRVEPSAVPGLPRSLRAIAEALIGADGGAPIAVEALGDADTPLVAACCARVALAVGDIAAAERAADVALTARPELAIAAALLVRTRLLRGSLSGAREVAESSGDAELLAVVNAIAAYEDRQPDALEKAAEEAHAAGLRGWSLVPLALALLGKGKPPADAQLELAVGAREPWADVLLVDAAILAGDIPRAEKLMQPWPEASEARARRRKLEE